MYRYWAFQSSEEFSALDTSCMAISFFAGSSSPVARADAAAAREGVNRGTVARDAHAMASTVRREGPAGRAGSRKGCLTESPGVGEWGRGVPGTDRKVSYQKKGVPGTRRARTGTERGTGAASVRAPAAPPR
ncbi:hypothetical protein GCM10010095_00310 [Streptomyces anthocyanicus]|nr:hypothetical protein JCM4020_06590 [Streptomyces coelicolor]BDE37380.1 hypothetical protein SLITK23_06250 [Streptomyces lividans]GGL19302.1 hypothetical protein GCM10010095_00310 [Streptomyces anthocyanicus]GHA26052.1 hypothetical protein GCM10010391_07110 [Streptomyces anthocyanicus]GHB90809.1 hypothetical protein GCM10010348_06010 [Streptomyces anthocyanicus]